MKLLFDLCCSDNYFSVFSSVTKSASLSDDGGMNQDDYNRVVHQSHAEQVKHILMSVFACHRGVGSAPLQYYSQLKTDNLFKMPFFI